MLYLGRAPKRGTGCFFFFGKIAGCAKQILDIYLKRNNIRNHKNNKCTMNICKKNGREYTLVFHSLEKDLGHIVKIQALECLEGVLIGTRVL